MALKKIGQIASCERNEKAAANGRNHMPNASAVV